MGRSANLICQGMTFKVMQSMGDTSECARNVFDAGLSVIEDTTIGIKRCIWKQTNWQKKLVSTACKIRVEAMELPNVVL